MSLSQVLSDDELRKILDQTLKGGPSEGMTQDELEVAVNWAITVRLNAALLEAVLRGEVAVTVQDGDVLFSTARAAAR